MSWKLRVISDSSFLQSPHLINPQILIISGLKQWLNPGPLFHSLTPGPHYLWPANLLWLSLFHPPNTTGVPASSPAPPNFTSTELHELKSDQPRSLPLPCPSPALLKTITSTHHSKPASLYKDNLPFLTNSIKNTFYSSRSYHASSLLSISVHTTVHHVLLISFSQLHHVTNTHLSFRMPFKNLFFRRRPLASDLLSHFPPYHPQGSLAYEPSSSGLSEHPGPTWALGN